VRAKFEDYYWQPKPEPGDSVRVRYNPADPEYYVRDDRLGAAHFGLVMLSSFTVLFLIGGITGL